MTERDFRYRIGSDEIEAFQVTDGSLFQDDLSPDWFDSKMLLTKSTADTTKAKHWLIVNEVETEIPPYGWICRDASGAIYVNDYSVMEAAEKVVKEVIKIPPVAKPMTDAALMLAAKLSKKPFDECKREDQMNVDQANANRQKMIDSLDPAEAFERGFRQTPTVVVDLEGKTLEQFQDEMRKDFKEYPAAFVEDDEDNGIYEVSSALTPHGDLVKAAREAFVVLNKHDGDPDEVVVAALMVLRDALALRQNWCDCAPGQCTGRADMWDCRKNSPLVQ
jgi:hypothetical protein